YSRFAWDTSQTPLVSVLVVYASLAAAVRPRVRWYHWLGLAACLLLAVWIHPTNIFLAPLAFACAARWPAWLRRPWLPVAAVLAGVVLAFAGLLYVRSAEELLIFAFDLGRLFSGTATYQFISGGASIDELHWFDAITWAFMAWGVLGFYQ